MTDQLVLIHAEARIEPEWHLDPATRERGRREVARARQILHQARDQAIAMQSADSLASAA